MHDTQTCTIQTPSDPYLFFHEQESGVNTFILFNQSHSNSDMSLCENQIIAVRFTEWSNNDLFLYRKSGVLHYKWSKWYEKKYDLIDSSQTTSIFTMPVPLSRKKYYIFEITIFVRNNLEGRFSSMPVFSELFYSGTVG